MGVIARPRLKTAILIAEDRATDTNGAGDSENTACLLRFAQRVVS
jgi:hypothetical protein